MPNAEFKWCRTERGMDCSLNHTLTLAENFSVAPHVLQRPRGRAAKMRRISCDSVCHLRLDFSLMLHAITVFSRSSCVSSTSFCTHHLMPRVYEWTSADFTSITVFDGIRTLCQFFTPLCFVHRQSQIAFLYHTVPCRLWTVGDGTL